MPTNLENMPKKFTNLCDTQFDQFDFPCDYGLILGHLKFKTVYFRQHFGDFFLFDVIKGRVNCHSITDSLYIPSELIGTFPILLEAIVLRASPSARCANAANTLYHLCF
jgi:hypothetical protein